MTRPPPVFAAGKRARRGSVLIIVLWICIGLVALTLYFANSMSSELRAADNRVGEIEARQAVASGTRYAAYVLTNFATGGVVPQPVVTGADIAATPTIDYYAEALPVGEATFWFIGRDPNADPTVSGTAPVFGLVDEASKLNLNTATSAMLQALPLPNMTPDLAAAIVSWRRPKSQSNGGDDSTYALLDPPRLSKGGPFESIDELRLVYGCTLDILFGEDTNRNGVLDANEDDGDQSAPRDTQDGQLQPGILEYVTVYTQQPNTGRTNISTLQGRQGLDGLLRRQGITPQRAAAIVRNVGMGTIGSVVQFMLQSRMTADEFAVIHTRITASTGATVQGLVNVNTASAVVLACIPGIGPDNAAALVAYRVANPDQLTSFAWLTQTSLSRANIIRAGPYITDQSYQFSADIAAVGRSGRGYCREKVIFDTRRATPRVLYRQDLSAYGWALGLPIRQKLKEPKQT